MKRKLITFLVILCMLASLVPAIPAAQAAGSNMIRVCYDTGFGCVFWSKGNTNPTDSADDFACDNEPFSVNSTTQIRLWIDPTRAVDRWRWEEDNELVFMEPIYAEDRNIYVRVRYPMSNGDWYDELVVDKGVAVKTGYTFKNNILSFKATEADGSVDVDIYWTDSDFAYMSFWPEDGEIMVDYGWNGVEQPVLAEEAAVTREMSQPDRCRRRVIVPASTQSVSFSWNSHLQRIWGDNVNHDDQWGDLTHLPDNEFTLYLDGTDGGEHPRNCYNIGFDFAQDWNYLFSVDYDMNGGLVFQTVGGGTPTATADCFLPRRGDERESWPSERSFAGANGAETIRLLFDETKAIDWEAWDREEPELQFVEPWHNDDRVISVIARYNDDDGWKEEALVEYGVPVTGVSFADNVLSYTPASGFDVEFAVFWTRDDYEFYHFVGTEEKPVMVEVNWWGDGAVNLTDPIDPADTMIRDGRMRIRVAEDVESLTFTWNEDDELRQINVDGLGEGGQWLTIMHPEGNSYTLQLNQTWDDGQPKDWYNIQFEFEGGGESMAMAFYDQSKGSIFWALGDDTPVADAEHYLDFGFEHSICFKQDGQLQPIHLLFDGSKGLDFDYYDQHNGAIRFVDSTVPEEDRIVGVYAVSSWCEGPVFWDGEVTENGAAQGVSYENGVLSFQPTNSSDLMLHVYWTQADADYDGFQGTEECPVIVEYRWWNNGEIPIPEGVSEENYAAYSGGGMARVRVPLEQESITFTWAEEYGVHRIGYSVRSEEGEDWIDFEVDQSQPHSFTLELNQTEMFDGNVEPCTWYQVEFEFFEDSRYQLWINWRESEGNVYFGLNEAPPPVEDSATYDLERYYAHSNGQAPIFATLDENGDPEIGKVYLRLDPTHSVNYFNDALTMYDLGAWEGYSPTIYMEYPLEGALGEWFEGPVVVDGQAVSDFVTFEDDVLSFTPVNEQPIIIHILWSHEDEAFWDFDTTPEKPVMVELMLGARVPVQLPADIPAEDVHIWHAAEHDYVRVRVPADRESVKITWPRVGIVALIEEDGAGENGEPLRVNFPTERAYEIRLNQQNWDGSPREFYSAVFWGYGWQENPFEDVADNAWYHEAVCFAVSMGITSGTSPTTFSPDNTMKRCEFITFLWAAAGRPEPTITECPFEDVADNAWYRRPVLWALENHITSGTSATTFGSDDPCTRAQVMMLLWRVGGSREPESQDCPFDDVADGIWYRKAVCWAVEQGITAGTTANTFSPDASCTRAMAVMFLFRQTLNTWRDGE